MSAREHQVGGSHYTGMKIQPFEFTISNDLGGVEHTIIKYVSRWRDKGGIDDVRKARHSADFLVEHSSHLIERREGRSLPLGGINPETYCRENGLPALESLIVHRIYRWQIECNSDALLLARISMDNLIRANTPELE